MKKLISIIILPVIMIGCVPVNRIRPIVDIQASPAMDDNRDYESDLAMCQSYAGSVDTGEAAVGGAIVGAVLLGAMGAAMGAALGDPGAGAAIGAAAGGANGLAGSVAAAEGRKVEIIIGCLQNRGWVVL